MLCRHRRLALHVVEVCTVQKIREVSIDISKRVRAERDRAIYKGIRRVTGYTMALLCSYCSQGIFNCYLEVKQCHQQPGSCSTQAVSMPRSSPGRSFKSDYQRHLTMQEKSCTKLQNTLDMSYSSILFNPAFLLVPLCFISLTRREETQRGAIH